MKYCVLDDTKLCMHCGDCDRCDLDPDKYCDNCCKCLDIDQPFVSMPVADIVTEQENSYLDEYYSPHEEEDDLSDLSDVMEEDLPPYYEVPDAQLAQEWEQRLRLLEEQEKQHMPQIYGARKRKDT